MYLKAAFCEITRTFRTSVGYIRNGETGNGVCVLLTRSEIIWVAGHQAQLGDLEPSSTRSHSRLGVAHSSHVHLVVRWLWVHAVQEIMLETHGDRAIVIASNGFIGTGPLAGLCMHLNSNSVSGCER